MNKAPIMPWVDQLAGAPATDFPARRDQIAVVMDEAAALTEQATGLLNKAAELRAKAFADFKLTITAKAGSEGKLFGSIGTSDIADAATSAGHKLARSEVRLPNGPLRVVGEHEVSVHLHTDVNVPLAISVVAEE